jgi:hypothetical protein
MQHDHDFAKFRLVDLRELLGSRQHPCVSIYMPAHKSGSETRQDPIRLKNLLRGARAEATALGFRSSEFDGWTAELRKLLQDTAFWAQQTDGLCAFAGPQTLRVWRLPKGFEDLAIVADRWHVTPLLSLLWQRNGYLVLALSQAAPRLLWCNLLEAARESPKDMPGGIDAALALDASDRTLQHHSGSGVSPTRGRGNTIFHGQGTNHDNRTTRLERYLRQVDDAVNRHLAKKGLGDLPIVLACVKELAGAYRRVSDLGELHPEFIAGNPDRLSDDDLREAAAKIVAPILHHEEQRALDRFGAYRASGRAAVDLDEVLRLAAHGAVAELFVSVDAHRWGKIRDEANGDVLEHGARRHGDIDLLDLAVHWTLDHDGVVHAVPHRQMPEQRQLAAVLRFVPAGR